MLTKLNRLFTHGLAVQGTGGTTALAKTQIGSDLTLPANGPWIIFGVWGQVAKVTTIPDQGTGGMLTLESISGDITPSPNPSNWPLVGSPISESANAGISVMPLNIYPINLQAAGKAVIRLSYTQQLAITTASAVQAGIIFGKNIPQMKPFNFCDGVRSSFASANEQSIGTITLAEKATKITGIFADLGKGDVATAGEAIMATIRLDSDDAKMPPFQFPCTRAYNAGDGTVVGQASVPQTQFIPVDIPVTGGARIDVFATTTQSVTGNADIQLFLAYE